MIPNIIHHVWIGPNPLPDIEQSFINSWKKLHTDWQFILWDNDNINNLKINDDCKQAIKNSDGLYACQADIIRYIAVNTFGGFYIDTDIECFRNINSLMSNDLEFIGLRPHKGNWITNAFFGSTKNNTVLNCLINNISSKKFNSQNPYGPVFLTKHVSKIFNFKKGQEIDQPANEKCLILKPDQFWSKDAENPYCRHLFKASWKKKIDVR